MINPKLKRLRRSMMFLSAQKPGMAKDAYIFEPDTLMFDLEDAVAENQKDAARFSLYHLLKTIDFGNVERMVRINGLDTPHWREDIRVCVAAGADSIRIAKTEKAEDVTTVVESIAAAEQEFHRPIGSTLVMCALESPLGIINAYEICRTCPERMIGVAISGGDFRREMHTSPVPGGIELLAARGQMLLAARAAKVQCFDTVFTDLDDEEGFRAEVIQNKQMGFDGKSLINPKQIAVVHEIFTPSPQEIAKAERVIRAIRENAAMGVGVFTLDGKMLDIAFVEGAERTIALAKASGVYKGDL